MARKELAVAILWHMHQPDYVDSLARRAKMPWVRLHALLSYYDMVRVLREVPEASANFNVTPVLLRQLELLAQDGVEDEFLALARPSPADLGPDARALLLRRFFAFNHSRRFGEIPRLAELWQKRSLLGPQIRPESTSHFSEADLRDLQVGFHLAWSGRTLREHERVAALFRQGRDFSEADKADLLAIQKEFLGGVLGAYRDAARQDCFELSCTPYSHPILPLLCDVQSAREAVPGLVLPAERFQRAGDAWYHVRAALTETERILGRRPAGMWPAEGSISEEAITVFATEKMRWLASDQEVLAASVAGALPPGDHFQAFRWGGSGMPALYFRDQELSNRIGFVYAAWSPQAAVDDLVGRLQTIRAALPAGPHLVPIMLDGENPWEFYGENGMPFLRRLYEGVAAAEGLRWTTLGRFLEDAGDASARPLARVQAGSWIRHDLTTWIGHQEKNAAWERLSRVRSWLEERLRSGGSLRELTLAGGGATVSAPDPDRLGPGVDTALARAWSALAAAEGSDWFWWYGDDHPTEFGAEFDELFRSHLLNVYRHLDEDPDPVLQVPLLLDPDKWPVRPPRFPLQVTLDGRVSSFFEWLDAGSCEIQRTGAMQRTDAPLARLYFGASCEALFLRLDPDPDAGLAPLAGLTLGVYRVDQETAPVRLRFPARIAGPGSLELEPDAATVVGPEPAGVYDHVIEVTIPWARLAVAAGQACEFIVALFRGRQRELVIPEGGALKLRAPIGPDDADDWLV